MRNRRAFIPVLAGGLVDTTAPTVAITSTESSPTFAATIPLTITFSEVVTGFAVGDITVVGCTLGALSTSDNITFTVTATPTANTITVDIAAGVCADAAGNTNTAATQFTIVSAKYGLALLFEASQLVGYNNGDAVTAFTDFSGNNRHASNKVGTVTYQTNVINSLPVVRFAADGGLATNAFAWGTDKFTIGIIAALPTGGTRMMCEFAPTGGNEAGGFSMYKQSNNYLAVFFSGSQHLLNARAIANNVFTHSCMVANRALSTNEITAYVNGDTSTGTRSPNSNTSGNFGTFALNIASRNNASLFSAGDYAVIYAYTTALTDAERVVIDGYWSDRYALGFVGYVATDGNTIPYTMSGGRVYVYSSPQASLTYTTTATSVTIDTFSDVYSVLATTADAGVLVDGVATGNAVHTADNWKQTTIALGAGSKTVKIINGYRNSAIYAGTYINKVAFNAAATRVTLPSTPRLYFYGDSILSGRAASRTSTLSLIPRLMGSFTGAIYNNAYDGRCLTYDAATEAARIAFAAQIATVSPTIVWIEIGTNDYSESTLTAANFETAYADLLDKVHAALPSAVVYAQTMIIRSTETANAHGNTTDDYRTAISNAQSTRSAWCNLVNGKTIMTTGDLADGVHPNNTGFGKYETAVKTALGLS